MKILKLLTILLAFVLVLTACSDSGKSDKKQTLKVTSDSIDKDGKISLDCVNSIANPDAKDQSPQLSWTKIDGAKYYAIVMYDLSASWSHMFVKNIDGDTVSIDQGKYSDYTYYAGPYPPKGSGAHRYEITVFALKDKTGEDGPLKDYKVDFSRYTDYLDKSADGKKGNIITKGSIIGTYESK